MTSPPDESPCSRRLNLEVSSFLFSHPQAIANSATCREEAMKASRVGLEEDQFQWYHGAEEIDTNRSSGPPKEMVSLRQQP